MSVWYGIDFSGDAGQWRAGGRRSNVWIARVEERALAELLPVQGLPAVGEEAPFLRLAALLRKGEYAAAAIDAPCCLPARYIEPFGGIDGLLRAVRDIPLAPGQPFPSGAQLVAMVTGGQPVQPPKPYRETERDWLRRGVNVRSTLWNGARGGAPMTAACLALLGQAERPLWPWADGSTTGLLVEGFPAGQLHAWGLPYNRYTGNDDIGLARRTVILDALQARLEIPPRYRATLLASADPLDAVLCACCAMAVSEGKVKYPPRLIAREEGWIAVHE